VDFCRALAASLFDDASKARFLAFPAKERLAALQSGGVDVLAGGPPWTQSRDAGQKVLYAATTFHDGQGFLVRKARQIASVRDLGPGPNGEVLSVCVQQGTSLELDLVDYFHSRKLDFQSRPFATLDEAAKAYDAKQCDALSADISALYAARAFLAQPSEHAILPDLISKAPRGPIVRQGDGQWFNIVRWTVFAMVDAEEFNVSSQNVDEALKSESAGVRRLLGVDGDHGEGLGLAVDWAYRIVKHVGNYGEVFERNLGQGSPLAMERRLDALWSKGGLMYAPPVR
jgi:general L-amino acid transport system substrate-binding protein